MNTLQLLTGLLITAICLGATWTDVKKGIIPNLITFPAIGAGLLLGYTTGGLPGAAASLSGALVTLIVPLLLFKFNAMGGGDVKLFAAIGALAGTETGLQVLMLSFSIGSLYGTAIWIAQGRLKQKIAYFTTAAKPFAAKAKEPQDKTTIKFAPSILTAWMIAVSLNIFYTAGGI
jgi:prepilin peptidase CpaA